MNPQGYLHTGDLVTLSFQGLFLGIQSLTQSVPIMKQILQTPLNSYFLLTTRKCYDISIREEKSITQYKQDQIYYGQAILFYHLISGKFLSYNRDIENKSMIQLTNGYKPNCEFSIKPIFKCQTIVTRKIRSEQSIILAPLETFNRQGNISLVVVKNQTRKLNRYFVCMKKNEHTMLQIQKVNSFNVSKKSISSINIYQICNIETKKNLFAEASHTKHRDIVTFEKSINELPSYFILKPKNTNFDRQKQVHKKQQLLTYNTPFYIYSWKQKRYLAINLIGDLCLARQKNQQSEFILENYSDKQLTNQSVVRIKHILTNKYISINYQNDQIQAISQARLIDTYFLVDVSVDNLRLNIFVNDANIIIQNQLANQTLSYRNKRNISKVLQELKNFIYGDLVTVADFMSMKSTINCKLTHNNQKLLADVGLINTLLRLYKRLLEESSHEEDVGNQHEQKDRSEQLSIILYIMMNIAGICLKNSTNIRSIIHELPILYQSMSSSHGAIQCLYHLFKDSKQLLLILENTTHKISKKQVLSFQILLNTITGQKFQNSTKCKVLKLLEALIITNQKQKILSHLTVLIGYLKQKKLDNVIMTIKSNDHYDLMVYLPQKKGLQQLDQMLTLHKTYEKQLQIIKNQLQLICGLCYSTSSLAYSYISQMFPEQMILRYLKANLQPDFKQIFMRMLIQIYLTKIGQNYSTSKAFIIIDKKNMSAKNRYSQLHQNSLRSNLIQYQDQNMIEMNNVLQSSHSKTIQKIQNLILQVTRKAILNEIIDSSFYMNIKALKKFLSLRILDQHQVQEFRILLTKFIGSYIENISKQNQKKKIILEILSIMKDYVNRQLEQIAEDFILRINSKSDSMDQEDIRLLFIQFTKQKPFFNNQIVANQFKFLPELIRQSLKNQQEDVCISAQELSKIVYQRHSIFIKCLKQKIVIESNWSLNFYNRVLSTKKSLAEQIQQFIGSQNHQQKKKANQLLQQNLNRKLQQLNFMFYETQSENIKTFSSLVQNIFREMNIFEMIVNFLNDSQKNFKKKKSKSQKIDVYSTCFEFISMFLRDNENNFKKFQDRFLDIKFVFQYPDRGQIKFLNYLIKMPKVRSIMINQIIQCVMLSFQHNIQPNPFTILAFLNILTYPHLDKQKIQQFVQLLIRQPQIFQWILKIRQKRGQYHFFWSYKTEDQNYHKDWAIYITLVFKLFLLILQNSTQRTTVSIQIIKYLNLSNILHLLQCPDILTSISLQNLEGVLLKKYAMKIFTKIYLNEIQKETQQVQNILAFLQSTFQSLSYTKQDVMGASAVLIDEVMKNSNDHESIIYESEIHPKSKLTCQSFQSNFNQNYLIIIRYYPFIVKILDILINSSTTGSSQSLLKRQAIMLLDSIYRKYKQFVISRLTYGQFNKYPKQYKNSIYTTQELFKRKIGFNIQIDQQEQDLQGYQPEIKEIFINRKIQNTIKCYQYASSRKEKKIYQAFLRLFHSSKIKQIIQQQQKKYALKLSNDQVKKLIQFYQKCISTKKLDCIKVLSVYDILLDQNQDACRDQQFIATRQRIMSVLQIQKQDLDNKKLHAYISVKTKLLRSKILRTEHSQLKNKINYMPFKQGFLFRICKFIQGENRLYAGSQLNEQCMVYSEKTPLTFQRNIDNLVIQQILIWIRNIIILIPYDLRNRYSSLFYQVTDLLKTYCDFIREFNSNYISQQLYEKTCLCLQIIYHYISGMKDKNPMINYLIQRQIWNDINLILSLDDSWNKNIQQLNDSLKQTFAKSVRSQVRFNSRSYLSQAKSIYMNSRMVYGDMIPDQYLPFLPIKSFYGQAKSNAIAILKQFNHTTNQIKQQVYSRIEITIINRNIYEIYMKHQRLFTKYQIPSVQINIDYKKQDQLRPIAQNLCLQNGVDLASLKMHIEDVCGTGQLKTQYYNLRLDATITSKKIQSAFSSIVQFIRDFFFLFISCFVSLCRKNTKNSQGVEQIEEKKLQQIMKFFLQKLGRIQLISRGKLYTVDFMVRPECRANKDMNKKFIQKINFVSMQLKIQSIYREGRNYMLYFQNQIQFYRRYNNFTFLTFLTKNFQMITYINFAIILWQNIMLILNSNSDQQYFIDTTLSQPFVWLQIASTIGAGLIVIAYFIKDFPLLLKLIDQELLLRSESYGSNYNNYNIVVKIGIKISMVVVNPRFAYHFIYSLIVALVFYNKLFVALLLLDVYFQIPNLKNLLMSIWRPKLQLFLAIVSLLLVQYFFSIFMFFSFKSQTSPYCNTLGSCFGFVFVTTYKAVGGFVGYLFQRQGELVTNVDFFQIFEDIYVVLIYQIFFALILAIIIDTFSLIRNQQSARKQYLDGCCIVCNLDKTRFNSSTVSFRTHIAINHNIWNYFYYYQYIFHKHPYQRSIYERQIFLNKSANWLPNNISSDIMQQQIDTMIKIN